MDIAILPGLLDRLVSGYFVSFNKATNVYSLHPIDREFCRPRVPAGAPDDGERDPQPYTRFALLGRAAAYHRQQRLPKEQRKRITDLEPQLLEFEYRVEMGDYNAAADLLRDIDFNYLHLWGYALRAITMHENLQGKITQSNLARWSIGNLGMAYQDTGRTPEAIASYEKALASARQEKNRRAEGAWLGNLGNAYYNLGQTQTAIDYHQQSLVIAREVGNRRGEGNDLGNLGSAYGDLGQVQTAIDYYQQALTIAREIGDRDSEGAWLGNLGNRYSNLGHVQTAIDYYQQALAIHREIGNRPSEGNNLGNLGIAQARLGDISGSLANLRQALSIVRDIQALRFISHKAALLAEALILAGDLDRALTAAVEACAVDVPENNYHAAAMRGIIEARLGNVDSARQSFTAAIGFADKLLAQTPGYYATLYARALSYAGLALVAGASLDPAIADYRAARDICDAAGILSDARGLLEQLMRCPGGDHLVGALAALS